MKEKICLYGFGVVGMAFFNRWLHKCYVDKNKYDIVCIVDKKMNELLNEARQYCNIPVFTSIEEAKINCFFDKVLITATMPSSVKYIKQILKINGIDNIEQLSEKEVYIDISGKCNLYCKSCQLSNRNTKYVDYDKRGMMSPELFEKIITKLKEEIDDFKYVYLYVLGEPLLNSGLPDIIRILHKYNLLAIISTNLSMKIDIERLMHSEPDCIKVSLSGFSQEIYSSTHNGGNIELVKSNLKRISNYNKHNLKRVPVIVGYHGYKNNQGEERRKMYEFCLENEMFFQYMDAGYFNRVKQWKMLEYNENDLSFVRTLYENPEEKLYPPIIDNKEKCAYIENGIFIDYKGDMTLCCIGLDDSAQYGSFLNTSIDEAKIKREKSNLCVICKKYGMQS